MSRSGGVSESMNQRIVSAPKASMIASGATTFFFDFDIFSDGPMVTGALVPRVNALPSRFSTSAGSSQRAVRVLVGLVADHALREQTRERLVDLHMAALVQRAREEARIEQMQDRVLDAADILIDRHPVVGRRTVDRIARACESVKRAKYQDESTKVSNVSVSRSALPLHFGHDVCFHVG